MCMGLQSRPHMFLQQSYLCFNHILAVHSTEVLHFPSPCHNLQLQQLLLWTQNCKGQHVHVQNLSAHMRSCTHTHSKWKLCKMCNSKDWAFCGCWKVQVQQVLWLDAQQFLLSQQVCRLICGATFMPTPLMDQRQQCHACVSMTLCAVCACMQRTCIKQTSVLSCTIWFQSCEDTVDHHSSVYIYIYIC